MPTQFGPPPVNLGDSLFGPTGGADLIEQLRQVAVNQEAAGRDAEESEARAEVEEQAAAGAFSEASLHNVGTLPGIDPMTRMMSLLEAANLRNERLQERAERMMDLVLQKLGDSGGNGH